MPNDTIKDIVMQILQMQEENPVQEYSLLEHFWDCYNAQPSLKDKLQTPEYNNLMIQKYKKCYHQTKNFYLGLVDEETRQ